jgi:hypothetical protein
MLSKIIVALGLLANTIESAASTPKRYSIPARRHKSDLSRRDGNEAAASNHVVVDFTFGGQLIPVALDSGSTFTFVASTLDTSTADTSVLPALFNPNISSTYHDEDIPSDALNCGGTSVVCSMGVDNVATAGLAAEGMSFGVATHVQDGVFSSGQAATMGFGRQPNDPSMWLPRDQTFWLRTGADLEMPYLFAVNIFQDQDGTFDFGFIDTAKYTGEITFAPMETTLTNWNFKMNGFAIGDGAKQTVDEYVGIVDTGGPNIGLPSFVVNPYFDSIGGSPSPGNSHSYPCSAYPPPDLTLYLENGGTLVLNGSFLVEPPSGSDTICDGRLDDSDQTEYNIGASVLDQKFVVFDHANARIGFADKRQDGQPEGVAPSSSSKAQFSGTDQSSSTAQSSDTATSSQAKRSSNIAEATTTTSSSIPSATPNSGSQSFDIWSEGSRVSIFVLSIIIIRNVL